MHCQKIKKLGKKEVNNYTKMRTYKTIYLPPVIWTMLRNMKVG